MRSVRTRGVALVFVASSAVIGVIAALPSCGGPPSKTCFADRVNALSVTEDAGAYRKCSACLQSKSAPKACCDAVGACDDDSEGTCVESFQAAHRCVLEGGANEESRCRDLLTNERSRALYTCMRSNCGEECEVPSCDLDPDVPLIANKECDSCIGGACCETLNACFGNRRCRFVVECITRHCPRTLAAGMAALSELPPEMLQALNDADCHGQLAASEGGDAPTACIQRCLDEFTPEGTTDDQNARCLAFGVFTCGATANCGSKCGAQANEGEWPEDNPDASPRDAASE